MRYTGPPGGFPLAGRTTALDRSSTAVMRNE